MAQAVTRKADPLSLKVAAKAASKAKPKVTHTILALALKPAAPSVLVRVPESEGPRTPHKPPHPVQGHHHHGPPPGLSFY